MLTLQRVALSIRHVIRQQRAGEKRALRRRNTDRYTSLQHHRVRETCLSSRARSQKLCRAARPVSIGPLSIGRLKNDIPHGGWCPRGRRAEDGRLHRRYSLRETDSSDYSERTKKNVEDTDGTLIINSGALSGGTAKTASYARSVHKPLMIVGLEETSLQQESTATTRCPSRWDTAGREPFELEGGRQECELDSYPAVSDVVATHYGVPNALHG